MKALRIIGMGVALALISSAALAFQEQQSGTAAPATAAVAGEAAPAPAANVAPGVAAKTASGGTEIRIPGIGTVGVIPKMDFGLELLYGANDTKAVVPVPRDPSEDLTIRGSMKHRF